MDLKSFIRDTLVQIVQGVEEAKQEFDRGDTNARVNPTLRSGGTDNFHADARPVEFDVALTVMSESTDRDGERIGAKVGVVAGFLGASANGESSGEKEGRDRNESISRVRFSVELAQPAHVRTYHHAGAMTAGRRDSYNGY